MIIDPPITSLAKRVDCRYTLIVEVAKRARGHRRCARHEHEHV